MPLKPNTTETGQVSGTNSSDRALLLLVILLATPVAFAIAVIALLALDDPQVAGEMLELLIREVRLGELLMLALVAITTRSGRAVQPKRKKNGATGDGPTQPPLERPAPTPPSRTDTRVVDIEL